MKPKFVLPSSAVTTCHRQRSFIFPSPNHGYWNSGGIWGQTIRAGSKTGGDLGNDESISEGRQTKEGERQKTGGDGKAVVDLAAIEAEMQRELTESELETLRLMEAEKFIERETGLNLHYTQSIYFLNF